MGLIVCLNPLLQIVRLKFELCKPLFPHIPGTLKLGQPCRLLLGPQGLGLTKLLFTPLEQAGLGCQLADLVLGGVEPRAQLIYAPHCG